VNGNRLTSCGQAIGQQTNSSGCAATAAEQHRIFDSGQMDSPCLAERLYGDIIHCLFSKLKTEP